MKIRTAVPALLLSLLIVSCAKTETTQESSAPPQTPAASTAAATETGAPAAQPVSEPATAAGPCTYVDAADLAALAGPDATCENLSEEQARLGKRNFAEYEVYVKADAEREMADTKKFNKRINPLPGVGDEAYISASETAVYVRKGNRFLHVASMGVTPAAPKPYKEGVRFLAERVTGKL